MTLSTLTSISAAPSHATTISSTGANAAGAPGTAAAGGTTAPASTPSAAPLPSTSVTLSTLSTEAGIVATLNGAGAAFPTYDATGLLNLVAQADMAAAGASGGAATGTGTTPAAANGAPASSDGAASVSGTVSGDWGTILKSNPGLTSVAVGYAVTQGIVNTLSTCA